MKYYTAKHILLEDQEDVSYIQEQLNKGITFEQLARDFSQCDTAACGGSLGRFKSGSMVPEFERALSKMQVGDIKYGVKTKFGVHTILRQE